ncbi:glycosyltransferase family 4 protein [Paenibacillus sp. NRS-1760]|uniref:glycosyltransferase family 4 protein n=1 Tax=Paenibacillus sp. NRS-1760 TaxID=3233902 RepID=UPI003D29A439
MKILLATYWLIPHVGGVWVYIQDLKASLERLGHEVDVFARHPDENSYYMANTGERVEKERFKRLVEGEIRAIYAPYQSLIDPWIVEQEIEFCSYALAASYFGLGNYDLIHTQDVISSRALWQIKPEEIPLISTIHGCLSTDYWVSLEGKLPSDTIWKYACAREYYGATSSDLTIVPTKWLHDTLVGYMVPSQHMEVIPYGMNVELYLQRMNERSTFKIPDAANVIICPARFDKVKGHSCLLDALYTLKQIRNDWICLLVGDGNLRSELESKANRLGLASHVIFTGSRNDVPSLIKQSDIVVLASLNDNHPFTVMEAQIAHKPLVVSNAGGIPEMVKHNHTGLVAKAGDSDELSHCLNALLDDHKLRNKLAANGYKWGVKRWSLTTMEQLTTHLYEQLLNKQRIRKVTHPPKHDGRHGAWISSSLREMYNMYIPQSFSIVDDHIVGSVLYQGK